MNERGLLVDCLQRLARAEIDYMLTGSMASNYWGIPRTTHDLDFVIHIVRRQVSRLAMAFDDEYYVDELSIHAAFAPPYQFNVIDTRSALKVDFWLLRQDEFEQAMFERRIQVELFSERAWICTAEDVVLHKLYWDWVPLFSNDAPLTSRPLMTA